MTLLSDFKTTTTYETLKRLRELRKMHWAIYKYDNVNSNFQNDDWAQIKMHWAFQINVNKNKMLMIKHICKQAFLKLRHTDFQMFRLLIHVRKHPKVYLLTVIIPSILCWYFSIIRMLYWKLKKWSKHGSSMASITIRMLYWCFCHLTTDVTLSL